MGLKKSTLDVKERKMPVIVSERAKKELKNLGAENESFLREYNNHHIFPQLDIHDQLVSVEGDLSPIFLLVVVPYDHFIPLLLVY